MAKSYDVEVEWIDKTTTPGRSVGNNAAYTQLIHTRAAGESSGSHEGRILSLLTASKNSNACKRRGASFRRFP